MIIFHKNQGVRSQKPITIGPGIRRPNIHCLRVIVKNKWPDWFESSKKGIYPSFIIHLILVPKLLSVASANKPPNVTIGVITAKYKNITHASDCKFIASLKSDK